jgi:hypothetical protein
MNLRLLQDHLAAFHRHLAAAADFPLLFHWESQQVFQDQWDIEAPDFRAMYDASLQNSTNRTLWKGERYAPKELMLLLIEAWPDFVRDMFKDLFNENKDVEGRMDRFLFHCEELLREYRDTHPDCIETRHYHEDYRMVSAYLAFRYPDQYAIYDHEPFVKFLKKVQAKDAPLVPDPGRYFKVARTVYSQLAKDQDLLATHYRRLEPGRHFMGKSLSLAGECIAAKSEVEFK